jgi:hypothetical protein
MTLHIHDQARLRLEPHYTALAELIDDVGGPCWAAFDTGAALQGFDGFPLRPPFHLIVPRGRNIHRVGHHVHTSDTLPPIDCEVAAGLPCMSPTRILFQIAATVSAERLTIALDGALRDRLTTEDFLHRRIAALRTSGRYGTPKLLAVIEGQEIVRGGQSFLEREFLRLVADLGFPRPTSQVVLGRRGDRFIRVDFRFEGTPVVAETFGYRWHRTTSQMNIDAERFNRLVLDGFVPLQFTYQQVVGEPEVINAALTEALERHGLRRRDSSAR